jgi:predicted AAA+ superfamily ATPase
MDVPARRRPRRHRPLAGPAVEARQTQTVRTLWGELAWQLGGAEGYALVKDADATGTSPGKEVLRDAARTYSRRASSSSTSWSPIVRQFPRGKVLSGGTYDSNLSFVQALTEACKLVPRAIMLASLPESEVEAGSQRGVRCACGRWRRPSAACRRSGSRSPPKRRSRSCGGGCLSRCATPPARTVCRAFADAYVAEGTKLPSETQEARYFDRLVQAYPIHPEVFDRLYEDWTTIEGFQRTRGVLKLMAKVITGCGRTRTRT